MRLRPLQQLMLLVGLASLLAVSAQFACTNSCNAERNAYFTSMDEINQNRIETFDAAVARQGLVLTAAQQGSLATDGQLYGVLKLDRPIKHPNGSVEMPEGWLPEIPEGHPWARPLTPSDEAFYSWFEERIVDARLFDPANPQHMDWANAYLQRASTNTPFQGWSYASSSCNN